MLLEWGRSQTLIISTDISLWGWQEGHTEGHSRRTDFIHVALQHDTAIHVPLTSVYLLGQGVDYWKGSTVFETHFL